MLIQKKSSKFLFEVYNPIEKNVSTELKQQQRKKFIHNLNLEKI